KGVAARCAGRHREPLARHVTAGRRSALWPIHQPPLRRPRARCAARHHAGESGCQRRRAAVLTVAAALSDEAAALSDEAWARICAAAGKHKPPLIPDAGTRERLSTILFEEYPAFHYDRERVAAALRRSERMLKNLKRLADDYRAQFAV